MESKLLETIGIDPGIILIAMFVLIIILFFIAIRTNMKYNRLKAKLYNVYAWKEWLKLRR